MKKIEGYVRKNVSALVMCLSLPCLVASSIAAELRIGITQNDQTPMGQGVAKFVELVRAKSNQKINAIGLTNGKAGNDREIQAKAIAGELEMVVGSSTLFAMHAKEMSIWDTPFLFSSFDEADFVLDGAPGKLVLERLDRAGMVGLGYWENGFRQFTNSARPVTRVDDFKGLRVRVQTNELHMNLFKTLGAEPVGLPFGEVYDALKSRNLDAQENPLATVVATKYYEVQTYLTLTRHLYSPFVVVASKKWWAGLAPVDRQVVLDAFVEARAYQRGVARSLANQSVAELKAQRMQVVELEPNERIRFERRTERLMSSVAKNVGPDVYTKVITDLFEYRLNKRGSNQQKK